jgi:hypothetical protein
MSPESICIDPAGCPPAVCDIERSTVNRSAIAAWRGSSSVKRRPGTLVAMV